MTTRLLTAVSVLALVSACSSQPEVSSLSPTEIGYNAYRAGDYAAAEAAYSSALAANRSNEAAMLGLAEVYEITGRASQAALLYREINATRSGTIRVWNDGRALQDGVNEVAYRRLGALGHQSTTSYAAPIAPAPTVYTPMPVPAPTVYTPAPTPAPTVYTPAPAPMTYSPEAAPIVYSSEPVPTAYSPAPAPVTFAPAPAPVAFTPAPAPTVYTPAPEPMTFAPAPEPMTFAPAPEPMTFAPAPAPMTYAPEPVPMTYAPEPAPMTFAPAPAPMSYSPAPATSYDTPAPLPAGYNPAPNYSLGQDGIVEYAEPTAPQFAPQPVPIDRGYGVNTSNEVYYTDPAATQRVEEPVFDRFDAALEEAIQSERSFEVYQPRPAQPAPATYAPAPTSFAPVPQPSALPRAQPGYGVVDGDFVYISAEDIANGATAPTPTPAGPAADSYGIPVPVTGSGIPVGTPSTYSAPRGVDVQNGISIPNLN